MIIQKIIAECQKITKIQGLYIIAFKNNDLNLRILKK